MVLVPCGGVNALLIACDFDGTITQRDTLRLIVAQYGSVEVWEEIEPRLRRGEVSLEQAMELEFAAVQATPQDVREFVRESAPLRAGFAELVEWAGDRGHRVVVLSSGFRTVIDSVLHEAGLGDLPVESHDAVFHPSGTTIRWSERGEPCGHCGRRCKRHDLGRHHDQEVVVYVGDGVSDRCAAQAADVIFARDDLARYLDEERVGFRAFEDFHDIRTALAEGEAA